MQRKKVLFILTAATLAPAASASAVFSIAPLTTQVHPGDTNDAFQVLLTNRSGADIPVAGFSFGVTTTDPNITFEAADTSTSVPYIFTGDSLDVIHSIPLSASSPGRSLVGLDFTNDGSGVMVASGQTVGLGRVFFDVSPGAPLLAPVIIDFSSNPGDNVLSGAGGNAIGVSLPAGTQIVTGASPAPEPATLLLVPGGLLLLLLRKRRWSV